MPEKKKKSRIKSSIVARLNSRLFLRLLGIYFGMDFLLSLLCCGGLLFWAEHQTADISALVEERGVPTAEATEWMQAGDFMAGYRKLETAYKEGKIKSIGISNFHGKKLEKLLAECEIKPHVIQMEAHPYYMDTETIDMLKDCGCRVMAWYPLGHGDKALMEEPVFVSLAEKYGKSSAQIILRWHVQMGNQIIPGSTNPAHIKANADIFDFELTDEEMAEIAKINKNVRYYNATPETEEGYASYAIDLDSQE